MSLANVKTKNIKYRTSETPPDTPFQRLLTNEARPLLRGYAHPHSWTAEQRVVLSLLRTRYQNNLDDVTEVFNAYYRGALPTLRGLKKGTLGVQWHDIKTQRKQFDLEATLKELIASPLSTISSEDALLNTLEFKALSLDIQLAKRPANKHAAYKLTAAQPHFNVKRKRDANFDTDSNLCESSSPLRSNDEGPISPMDAKFSAVSPPRTPTAFTSRSRPTEIYGWMMTPPSSDRVLRRSTYSFPEGLNSPSKSRNPRTRRAQDPLIGFRGFSDLSQGRNGPAGFVAGAFINTARIPPCPVDKDVGYRREAIRHVENCKTQPSPFISLTSNPIRAMMVASAKQRKTTGYLAIIDLHQLDREGILKDAKSLQLEPEVSIKYHSGGEFLVYGQVRKSAIISIIAISQLIDSPPAILHNPDPFGICIITKQAWSGKWARIQVNKNRLGFSYQSGIAVGLLAYKLGLPPQYLSAAVETILEEWNFVDREVILWKENGPFSDGVYHSFYDTKADHIIPDTVALTNESESDFGRFIPQLEEFANQTSHLPFGDALVYTVQEPPIHLANVQHDSLPDIERIGGPFMDTLHVPMSTPELISLDDSEEAEKCDMLRSLQGPRGSNMGNKKSEAVGLNEDAVNYAYAWTGM